MPSYRGYSRIIQRNMDNNNTNDEKKKEVGSQTYKNKMKSQVAEGVSENAVDIRVVLTKENKSLRKRMDKLEKHVRSLSSQLDKAIKQVEEEKIKSRDLRLENSKVKEETALFEVTHRTLTDKISILTRDLDISNNLPDNFRAEIAELTSKYKRESNQVTKLTHMVKQLQDEKPRKVKLLNSRIDDMKKEITVKDKTISVLQGKLTEKDKEINRLRVLLTKPDHVSPSNTLFNALAGKVTKDNLSAYKSVSEIVRKIEEITNASNQSSGLSVELYGVVKTDSSGTWLLEDINQMVYPVVIPDYFEVEENYPVRAIKNHLGLVEVVKVYAKEAKKESSRGIRLRPRNDNLGKKGLSDALEDTKKGSIFWGTFRVLLIGSQNLVKYRDNLTLFGVQVTLHDSYSDSDALLRDKVMATDIIILFSRHSSQKSLTLAKTRSDILELIDRDNEETVLTRVRYAGIKHGYIVTGI